MEQQQQPRTQQSLFQEQMSQMSQMPVKSQSQPNFNQIQQQSSQNFFQVVKLN